MDLDDTLEAIGGFGRYQKLTFVLMGLVQFLECGYLLGIVFIGEKFDYFCKSSGQLDDNITTILSAVNATQCSNVYSNHSVEDTMSCAQGWTFVKDPGAETIVSEWQLVCSEDYIVDLSSSVFVAGLMAGSLMVSPLSDKFGRKMVLLVSLAIRTILAFGLAYTQDYIQFTVLRFFIGALHRTNCIISFIMLTEVLPPKFRTKPGIALQFFWAMGLMSLAVVAFLLPNWRHFELAICLPTLLMISYYWLVDESPRWLISRQRFREAQLVLSRAAKLNRVKLPNPVSDLGGSIPHHLAETGCVQQTESVSGVAVSDDLPVCGNSQSLLHNNSGNCDSQHITSCHGDVDSHSDDRYLDSPNVTAISQEKLALDRSGDDKTTDAQNLLMTNGSVSGKSGGEAQQEMERLVVESSIECSSQKKGPFDLVGIKTVSNHRLVTEGASQFKNLAQMVKSKTMMKYTLIIYYLWMVNSLAYYGISLSTSDLAGNKYVNFFLSGAVELPAYVIVMFMLDGCGRCKPMCVFQILSGVANFVTVFIPNTTDSGYDLSWLVTFLAMIGKFGITGSFCSLLLYSAEIYPTNIRNTAYGIASFWDTLGGMAAPFILYKARWIPQLPRTLFGVAAILAGVLMMLMPETGDKAMPETIEEVEKWDAKTPVGHCCCRHRPEEGENYGGSAEQR